MNVQDVFSNQKVKQVFSYIRMRDKASKQEINKYCGLTVSTSTRILEELLSGGWILEEGFGRSTGGRKPIIYEINPVRGFVFGLEISRFHSKLVLCNMKHEKLDVIGWPMTKEMTPERLIELVTSAVRTMLARHQLDRVQIIGIGVGAVGPLDRLNGVVINPKHFAAPGWENVNIKMMLEEQLNIPAVLDNGVNTAVLGEYWSDSALQYKHLLYLHAGVGMRSAYITDGKLVYGAMDMEGSVGQMIIQTDGAAHREPGGNYGSWESYATVYALETLVKAGLKAGRESLLASWGYRPEEVSYTLLLKALKEKDPFVAECFTQCATYFGIGLANLINIMHPEKVILGGPLMTDNDMFFRIATQVAIKKTYYYPTYQVIFSRGSLGEDAISIGAAVMVLNQLSE